MPNWCTADLEISGPEDDVNRIADTKLDFERIRPTPPEMLGWPKSRILRAIAKLYAGITHREPRAPAGPDGLSLWYDWRCDNWGTKWTANVEIIHRNPGLLQAKLETAGDIPEAILRHLSTRFPDVTFHILDCMEETGAFGGSVKYRGGDCVENTIHEPSQEELAQRGITQA